MEPINKTLITVISIVVGVTISIAFGSVHPVLIALGINTIWIGKAVWNNAILEFRVINLKRQLDNTEKPLANR